MALLQDFKHQGDRGQGDGVLGEGLDAVVNDLGVVDDVVLCDEFLEEDQPVLGSVDLAKVLVHALFDLLDVGLSQVGPTLFEPGVDQVVAKLVSH